MGRNKRPPAEAIADELLERRSPAPALDLIRAIHAINPTDRGLSARETARLYGIKSRLQSVLIESCADDLDFAHDPTNPDFISVSHRTLGLDACHAKLSELTDTARSFTQFRIDTSVPKRDENRSIDTLKRRQRKSASPSTSPAADDLISLGDAARRSSEPIEARDRYREALDYPALEAAARQGLLEVMVDDLGADSEAIELVGSLPTSVAALPLFRVLRAIATARSGDMEEALGLVHQLDHPRAADVWAVVAVRRIKSGDADGARSAVDEVRRRSSIHPDLPELDRILAISVIEARRPKEAEALGCLAAGDLDGAESLARTVRTRWGDSDVTGRVFRLVDERRRADRIVSLKQEVDAALEADRFDAADSIATRIEELGADVTALLARIASGRERVRESARQPWEALALKCQSEGDLEGAERHALEARQRGGDSEVIRRVLGDVRQVRTAAKLAELQKDAEDALAAGHYDVAERCARQLEKGHVDVADLRARILVEREQQRATATALESARISEAIRSDLATGLDFWLAADPEVRARVEAAAENQRLLDWLTDALAHRAKPNVALVAAVRALASAVDRLDVQDASGAIDILAPHVGRLVGVVTAQNVSHQARRTLDAQVDAACVNALTSGSEALVRGNLAHARAALERIGETPPSALRARVEAFKQGVKHAEKREQRIAKIEEFAAAEKWLEARDEVDALLKCHPEINGEAWLNRRATLSAALRRAWQVQAWNDTGVNAAPEDALYLAARLEHGRTAHWRYLATGELVHVDCVGPWLLLHITDAANATIRRRVAMRTPVALGMIAFHVAERVAWIVDKEGYILALDLQNLEILAWRSLKDLIDLSHGLQCAFIFGGRFAWIARNNAEAPTFTVIDLAEWNVVSHPPDTNFDALMTSFHAASVVMLARGGRGAVLRFLSARGEPGDAAEIRDDCRPFALAAHPDGEQVVVFDAGSGPKSALLVYLAAPGRPPTARRIVVDDFDDLRRPSVVVGRATNQVFVDTAERSGRRRLTALTVSKFDVTVDWSVAVPTSFNTVRDDDGVAVGVYNGSDRPRFVSLGISPPSFTHASHWGLPHLDPSVVCDAGDARPSVVAEINDAARSRSMQDLAKWLLRAGTQRSIEGVADLCLAVLRFGGLDQVVGLMLDAALPNHCDHPEIRLIRASVAAMRSDWAGVIDALGPSDLPGLRPARAAHWLHLRGLAQLHVGQPELAWAAWSAGATIEGGRCGLDRVVDLVAPLSEDDDCCPGGPDGLVVAARRAVMTANDCLARGDGVGALAMIACPATAMAADVQTLAVWTEALLAVPPTTIEGWFAALWVMRTLIGHLTGQGHVGLLTVLPPSAARWSEERLEATARRGDAWISATNPPAYDRSAPLAAITT